FLVVILLTIGSNAPMARAGYTYGGAPGSYGVGWGQPAGGYRPMIGAGYGRPVVSAYPYGYYPYYGYPPAVSGQTPAAVALPLPPSPWVYSYLPPTRVAPRVQRTIPKNTNEPSESEKRAKRLTDELARVTRERDVAQAELALWTALGVSRDQVRAFQVELARL